MDWLRQIPIGQYVDGSEGWMRRLDPRLKLAWSLVFLLTPVLAGPLWRVALVLILLTITALSGLPRRVWWKSFLVLIILAVVAGLLSVFFPVADPPAAFSIRDPAELPGAVADGPTWDLLRVGPFQLGALRLGPLVVDRASALLGLRTSTLTFTVIHSVNLVLITTTPEDLVWGLSWYLSPLATLGLPIERVGFQLLLALRFLPLVQEELQNLLRSMTSRIVSLRSLGFKAGLGIIFAVSERLLVNILLRAEQGADALVARGGRILGPSRFHLPSEQPSLWINTLAILVLLLVISLRSQYGAL
ncbi:energy-coupling factor transporter transmembrane protein EcfT [Synechococcus sp. M16CYN]|uniref:energy-coupling factor transporter transmembrane component T family protein n=1 Tax=Synechococcus sp. M16CYN TaxID=3103139 RepID=UPI003244B797